MSILAIVAIACLPSDDISYSSVLPLNQGRWLTSFLSLYTPSASNPSPPSRLSSVVPLETHTKPFNPRMISTPVGPQGGGIWWKCDFRRLIRRGGRVRRCPLRSCLSAGKFQKALSSPCRISMIEYVGTLLRLPLMLGPLLPVARHQLDTVSETLGTYITLC